VCIYGAAIGRRMEAACLLGVGGVLSTEPRGAAPARGRLSWRVGSARPGLASRERHNRILPQQADLFRQEPGAEWVEVDLNGVRVERRRPFGGSWLGLLLLGTAAALRACFRWKWKPAPKEEHI